MDPLPDTDALVAGMTMVPGLFSRNRMFSLFQRERMREARRRAAFLRGMARQLVHAGSRLRILVCEPRDVATGDAVEPKVHLRYAIDALRYERQAWLSPVEFACVARICERAGVPCLVSTPEHGEQLRAALKRLSSGIVLADGEPTAPEVDINPRDGDG
jgi:glycine/D-amino acid oxidase-like deaminating enzyme